MKIVGRLIRSFQYAFEGIAWAFIHNPTLQVHVLITVIVLSASLFFRISHEELAMVWVMIVIVMTAEMVNTSLEEMTDLIIKEHRPEAKIAKDVGAGMVFISALGAFIVGIVIFTPYIIRLLSQS